MTSRQRLLTSTALGTVLALSLAIPVSAEDAFSLPAVSAPNSKVGAFAGSVGGDFAFGATGSFAVPLHDQWGAQVDGMVGGAGGAAFFGVGGHLFWRDPNKGLIGGYASWVGWDKSVTSTVVTDSGPDAFQITSGADVGKVGVEGEAYLGRLSVEGLAAYQFGTTTGLAARGTLAFYPTDDLRFDVGVYHLAGVGAGVRGGLEWSPQGSHISLFADATAAGGGSWSAIGGVRVFFGDNNKSLIQRHREDDPGNLLPEDLHKLGGAIQCEFGEYSPDDGGSCPGGEG